MKVKLVNVAEYDLKEEKTTEIPFNTFTNLCGLCGINENIDDDLPKVRLFKTIGEFISLPKSEFDELNQKKGIRILSNGQFLVFLNKNSENEKKNTEAKNNATADT